MQQRTPEWFSARRGKLTASRLGAAAGVCPFLSRKKYMTELLTEPEFKGNAATSWGTRNEHNACHDYMVRTGNLVTKFGFQCHPDIEWLGGSPDGFVGDRGMIEIKCPFHKLVCHERVPAHYLCQVNALLEIFDRDWCDFVSWTPMRMRIHRVYRDPLLWDFLLDRYTCFHACMVRGAPMPNQSSAEKDATLERLCLADDGVEYDFWPEPDACDSPPLDYTLECPDWVQGGSKRVIQYWWQHPSAKRMKGQTALTDYF